MSSPCCVLARQCIETTSGVAIRIQIYVERVRISADGVVERRDQTDVLGFFTNRFAPKPYRDVKGVMMVMGELV